MAELIFFVLIMIEQTLVVVGIVQCVRDRCWEIDDYDEWASAHGIDIQ